MSCNHVGSSVFDSPIINVSVTGKRIKLLYVIIHIFSLVPTVSFTQLMPPALAQNEVATLTCTPSNALSPISWFTS